MTVDANGEVLSVTVTESRFRPSDVAVLLASRRAESEPRGSHGLPLSIATDPANRGRFRVPEPVVDFALQKYNNEVKKFRDKWGKDTDLDPYLFRVELEGD